MNTHTPPHGLTPLPPDSRDFSLGGAYRLPPLEELPEVYHSPAPKHIKDQKNSDFCTQYAFCAASEWQEEVLLEPSYTFALAKFIQKSPASWGCDLRSAAKAHVEYGAIEEAKSPYSIRNKDVQWLRYLRNWPVDLAEDAKEHKKESYMAVTGQHETAFDNIRAAIYAFKDQKKLPVIGVEWSWPNSQKVMNLPGDRSPMGHAVLVRGWHKDYLIIQNSYGPRVGDGGLHHIHKDLINRFVGRYGAFMLTDAPRTEAEKAIENNHYLNDEWWRRLWLFIINLFK